MEKILKWHQMGPGGFSLTNPDLADILGRTDLDFGNFYCFDFWIPNSWIYRSPDFQIFRNLAWAKLGLGLGRAWARDSWRTLRSSSLDQKVGEIQGQYRENPISARPV